nr:MAG TPA: hypothetical protein [Caudoviricetes sp.]
MSLKISPLVNPYYIYFKILFAKLANIYVDITPKIRVLQFISFAALVNKGVMPPKTSAANISLDKSKKYPASFSRLVLSFSLPSFFASCFSLQFPIYILH